MQYDRMRIFDIYWHIINIYIYTSLHIYIYIHNRHFSLIYIHTYTSNKHTHLTRHKIHVPTVLHDFKFSFFVTFFFAAAV